MSGCSFLHDNRMLRSALAVMLGSWMLGAAADAATLTVLYHFDHKSGTESQAGLLLDKRGNLYGTAPSGGKSGGGTIFGLANGQEKTLFSFSGAASSPVAGLIADKQGNLFGTATLDDGGTVFELTPQRNFTILHTFLRRRDGDLPNSKLILTGKWLYGTTVYGGGGHNCSGGCGTAFGVTRDGKSEHVIYAFQGGSDGAYPVAGLIEDNQGNFYGTTASGGGVSCDGYACGTVFMLTANGAETVLHAFTGYLDGAQPEGGLVADAQGNFYGTTSGGGSNNAGTVYKISEGTENVLYSFKGGSDGSYPRGSLIIDSAGNLYGTTQEGGGGCRKHTYGLGCGTVFEVTPSGAETVLAALNARHDPRAPYAGLVTDGQGNLYGTAANGGGGCYPEGCGGVFEVSP
jgi:uncharacterized repeat protein (TIGR03803 family)